MSRKQIFCADDWGMSPGINTGILELARKNLLWSVSLMGNTDFLCDGLDELLSYGKNGLRFFIHFNLTYGKFLDGHQKCPSLVQDDGQFSSFGRLALKSYFGKVSPDECTIIFNHQLSELRKFKIPITGVDGHHHIHLLPGICEAIAKTQKENKITDFRLMSDQHHLPSFIQSKIAKRKLCNLGLNLVSCGYLLKNDLSSKNVFYNKIAQFERLIVHPAAFDDFEQSGVTDSLRAERVSELKKILEYTS